MDVASAKARLTYAGAYSATRAQQQSRWRSIRAAPIHRLMQCQEGTVRIPQGCEQTGIRPSAGAPLDAIPGVSHSRWRAGQTKPTTHSLRLPPCRIKLRFSDGDGREDAVGEVEPAAEFADAAAAVPALAAAGGAGSATAAASAAVSTSSSSGIGCGVGSGGGGNMTVVLRIRPLSEAERAVETHSDPVLLVENDTTVRVVAPEVSRWW